MQLGPSAGVPPVASGAFGEDGASPWHGRLAREPELLLQYRALMIGRMMPLSPRSRAGRPCHGL